MDLHSRYPSLADLKHRARRRIPKFVWEYLDSGTGTEATLRRNRAMLDQVLFKPSILHGEFDPDLSVTLFGQTHPLPIGIAPVGMSGLMWPDAERKLARAATEAQIPYCISTVATQTPEDVGPCLSGNGWFQMYPPRDPEIRADMIKRAKDSGFSVLVLTVDVPVASRRERQVRSGLVQPPKLTPRLMAQVLMRPTWARGMALRKLPHMKTLDRYTENVIARNPTAHVGYLLRTSPTWDYLKELRAAWDGPLVVKGVLNADDAARLETEGVDAIWVSNHAGRQFDAAPSAIEALPAVRQATTLPVLFDSGIETGLDILRARALGADMVFMGRGFHYALGALDTEGPAHLLDVLKKDLQANMGQLGFRNLTEVYGQTWSTPFALPQVRE
jgi:L-lactate dehydrogenase (cytochrome)